jgi:hypothetical protein
MTLSRLHARGPGERERERERSFMDNPEVTEREEKEVG